MDPNIDPNLKPPVDETRRRLAKAGLAAPAVLGALSSRPVLGASLHHCTPSGHISGFASPNPGATPPCKTLGHVPSHFAASTTNWPGGSGGPFINTDETPRLFKDAPAGLGIFHGVAVQFADAYQITDGGGSHIRDATIWDVLKQCSVSVPGGTCITGETLAAKPGYSTDLTLGQEAVTAAMNAIIGYPATFPIPIQQVVEMFNKVVNGGLYQVTHTNNWNAAEVKHYLQSLHA